MRRTVTLIVCSIVVVIVALMAIPVIAAAMIQPDVVLDGPANDILDVDGTAMAPDGTGGVVYRKEVGGVAHVFVVQFLNGHWNSPVEVDTEDQFGASQPAIAAGEGGRLLVVWVQPRNVSHGEITESELMGASLQPGADGFGQSILVDPEVGEPFTGDVSAVTPRLAMAPDGAAYVVYRVVRDDCQAGDEQNIAFNPLCRPHTNDKVVEVRAARFQYLTWSSLGAVNRAAQVAMLDPAMTNVPAIGIALDGEGVVAWQEPGNDGVARIWVRRLFGVVQGNVLEASPEAIGGRPVSSNADAPAIAVGAYGEAQLAYGIEGAPGSAVGNPELFLNQLPSALDPRGAQLTAARSLTTVQGSLEPPSAALDAQGDYRLAWTQGGSVRALSGSAQTLGSSLAIGSAAGPALTAINPAGGGTTAWMAPAGAPPVVDVREDFAKGAFQTARLAGNVPGAVSGLALGGSGKGDALLAWMQGSSGQSEVVGDFVQAPPSQFLLDAPVGWVRSRRVTISWEASTDAVPGIVYAVYVDGRPEVKGLRGLSASLRAPALGDGVHHVQVLATDAAGQQTMSVTQELKVDANPPVVRVRLIDHDRAVRVTVRDRASGVNAHATRIAFGDGHDSRGRVNVTHIYERAGTYTILAQVRDRVGNHARVQLRVRVA